jgi:pimeloyl-ACP methyl ester carboxylesterase
MGAVKNILLVHGFWADGSCYDRIIPSLLADGYDVIAVQNPLTSLQDDIAATKRALDRTQGQCLLVGHSWGGFVITEIGHEDRVSGLVYIAALAPDAGESMLDLMGSYGPPSPHFQESDGFVWISRGGVDEILAQGLPEERRALLHATQTPPSASLMAVKAGAAAWKGKPSWYVIATNDKAVPPDLQYKLSRRMGATTVSVPSSHFPMISHPDEVLAVIREAAASGNQGAFGPSG